MLRNSAPASGSLRQFWASDGAGLGIAVLDRTANGAFQSRLSKTGPRCVSRCLSSCYCFMPVAGRSEAARIELPKIDLRMNRRSAVNLLLQITSELESIGCQQPCPVFP